VRGMQL